ncbi:hypothetical protein [Halocola ammonii]
MNKMKTFIFFLISTLAGLSASGQCGTTGDTIFVNSQSELDALSSCSQISGSLYINDGDIENLSPLSSLVSIEEHLILFENISMLSLEGLDQLESVGGDLKLISNFTMQDITNLGSLSEVGGDIYIESNLGLDNLDGLQQITSLEGSFEIYDNPTIEDLTGFENLTFVGGDFILNEFQDGLTDLTALANLEEIGGSLEIYLRGISTLEGLESLSAVGNNLRIDSTLLLFDLDPLEELTTIGGSLQIVNNESMFSIAGMTALTEIEGDVEITNNPGLGNCCSLKPLMDQEPMQIGGEIVLENNASGCNTEAEILECIIDNVAESLESATQILVQNRELRISSKSDFRFQVIDLSGRVLNTGGSNNGVVRVNLSSQKSRLVVVRVLNDLGQSHARKVVIR